MWILQDPKKAFRLIAGSVTTVVKRAVVSGCPIGGTLTSCDHFGIPSTSHWTGAAIIV